MNREWLDCLMEIPIEDYQAFKDSTTLKTELDVSKKFEVLDYSWLNVVEKYLPFLKNTMESSSLILVEVEEAKKNYENRFLYTLFCRLDEFLKKQYDILLEQEKASDESTLRVVGNSSYRNEDISLEVSLKVKRKEVETKKNSQKLIKERLEQIFEFLKPLRDCVFMKTLEGASLVRSPIRHTGLLVTHENYKKILELFDFLESYAILEKAFSVKNKPSTNDNFMIPYFMNYQLFSEPSLLLEKDEDFLRKYLEGIIRQFVEESTVDEKSFKKMINKIFEEEYAKKKSREKNIATIFMKSFDTYQKQTKDAIRTLKG